jgi:hypothetical protein
MSPRLVFVIIFVILGSATVEFIARLLERLP